MRNDYDLVFIRHGQSEANKLNIFTGWRDSPLSELGVSEARAAGKLLKADDAVALQIGVATSGYYVRNAQSPTAAELAGFLKGL